MAEWIAHTGYHPTAAEYGRLWVRAARHDWRQWIRQSSAKQGNVHTVATSQCIYAKFAVQLRTMGL